VYYTAPLLKRFSSDFSSARHSRQFVQVILDNPQEERIQLRIIPFPGQFCQWQVFLPGIGIDIDEGESVSHEDVVPQQACDAAVPVFERMDVLEFVVD
jgi:hypothetical protein